MSTQTACVIGHPIKHSRSPLIHNYWIKKHGLDAHYDLMDVSPSDLPNFVEKLRQPEMSGCNVTIPHKQAILPLLDQITDQARAIGAVNTVFKKDGHLIGDNSDAAGFCANLDDKQPNWDKNIETIGIIGAGGAARAILFALQQRTKAKLILFNRSPEKAENLAQTMSTNAGSISAIEAKPLNQINAQISSLDLLINSSALGMSAPQTDPQFKATAPHGIEIGKMHTAAIVTDIVYTPLKTPILACAERNGLKTVDGLGMLLHQAVPGFKYWFGPEPKVDATLRQILEHDVIQAALGSAKGRTKDPA